MRLPYTSSKQCCLVEGIHMLTCMDSVGDGWGQAHIKVKNVTYCDEFNFGFQQDTQIELNHDVVK